MNESSTPGTDDVIFYSSNDIDDIKVISSQIIHVEIPVSSSFVIDRKETPEEEHKRKRINRIVGFFASLIFLTCVVLVCSSMMMSKNIDELVRQSNVLLRQKTVTKTSMHTPILVEISNSTEP
ncbi:uncharacterized protein LOC134705043 isoform X2 [Mytilus trossulus]|uniref:uncharacterized protein LOC134705043 isoform X2 n=1 Tax=Mytilus trossulus TaxID=6551 RepID=UPI003006EC98